jgi:tripartite ATP-independent transporter DctM subunit
MIGPEQRFKFSKQTQAPGQIMIEHLDLLLFAFTCILLMTGYPVAFTLAGSALLFALLGLWLGVFDLGYITALPQRIYGTMTNEVLIAVPLFVFMGVMLERSKVAEELLDSMGKLFGTLRGGLGISVCIVGALLAASTGIVGATVVTMGLLSLPTMLKRNYDVPLATGIIAAAGTLGQIIPPSIVLILLGDVISSAYQKAQLEQGIMSPETMSVGDIFAGALLPGLMLVGFYIAYVIFVSITQPSKAPALSQEDLGDPKTLYRDAFRALLPPLALMIAVLGSILAGIATPTEAAAVGALGAILLAGHRANTQSSKGLARWLILGAPVGFLVLILMTANIDLRIGRAQISPVEKFGINFAIGLCTLIGLGILASLGRTWKAGVLPEVVRSTAQITSMVFVILIGAALFSLVFRGFGGDETVHAILESMPGGTFGAMLVVMALMFVLGFFLDFIEITFVVVPIVAPVLLMMGMDPVWLGVMMAINLQTSFLTPPFGFALFYLRGVAPPEVQTLQIYKGAIPFVIIQIFALCLIALFPEIATWLPAKVFG